MKKILTSFIAHFFFFFAQQESKIVLEWTDKTEYFLGTIK